MLANHKQPADDTPAFGRVGVPGDSFDAYRLFGAIHAGTIDAKEPKSPSAADEVRFITGINADGTINNNSYWGDTGGTAYKWGAPTAGTSGGTVTYSFNAAAHWTSQEQHTFKMALGLWQSIADIHFKEVKSGANLDFRRGHDGGAYTSLNASNGHGDVLGTPPKTGGFISIDTSVPGFDLSGSFDKYGGYGLSTIEHELGHALGFGHGGDYNGSVDPATQQYSAFDDRMYSIMSYIWWGDTDAKYGDQNPVQGTNWGPDTDNTGSIEAPHTFMGLDIIGIQELYGASTNGPFTGGQTYGFHSNVKGAIHDYFDFTVNTHPVVTLYNQGIDNTLDLSGYTVSSTIDLTPGTFSSMNGMVNNLYIDATTQIDTAVGGSAGDILIANSFGDTLTGGGGKDMFEFGKAKVANTITDFAEGSDRVAIDVKGVDKFADLKIAGDGHGGALVSWKGGGSVDLAGVDPNSLRSKDFVFGSNALPNDPHLALLHVVSPVETHHLAIA